MTRLTVLPLSAGDARVARQLGSCAWLPPRHKVYEDNCGKKPEILSEEHALRERLFYKSASFTNSLRFSGLRVLRTVPSEDFRRRAMVASENSRVDRNLLTVEKL